MEPTESMAPTESNEPEAGVYDDWQWHIGGRFPQGRAPEQAYVHIGAFVAWLALHGMIDARGLPPEDAKEAETVIARLDERTEPFTALLEPTQGRLSDSFLTAEGRGFAGAYYAPEYGFPRDWQRTFGRAADAYDVPGTWETYDRIEPLIEERYEEWLEAGRPELMALPGLMGRLARLLDRRHTH